MTQPATTTPQASAEQTLALLWTRMREQGDMPGLTRAVTAILGAMRGEDEQEFNMTQTVLFSQAIESSLWHGGPFDMAVEMGPHPALKGPAEQTIKNVFVTDGAPLVHRFRCSSESLA